MHGDQVNNTLDIIFVRKKKLKKHKKIQNIMPGFNIDTDGALIWITIRDPFY